MDWLEEQVVWHSREDLASGNNCIDEVDLDGNVLSQNDLGHPELVWAMLFSMVRDEDTGAPTVVSTSQRKPSRLS